MSLAFLLYIQLASFVLALVMLLPIFLKIDQNVRRQHSHVKVFLQYVAAGILTWFVLSYPLVATHRRLGLSKEPLLYGLAVIIAGTISGFALYRQRHFESRDVGCLVGVGFVCMMFVISIFAALLILGALR